MAEYASGERASGEPPAASAVTPVTSRIDGKPRAVDTGPREKGGAPEHALSVLIAGLINVSSGVVT